MFSKFKFFKSAVVVPFVLTSKVFAANGSYAGLGRITPLVVISCFLFGSIPI